MQREQQIDVLEELPELDDLELIERVGFSTQLDFPAVCIGKSQIYFNVKATPFLRTWKRVRVYITPEYIVFLPASELDKEAFKIFVGGDKTGMRVGKPVALTARHPQTGTYKLLKYKDGFAVKRYEPINPPQ